MVDAIVVNHWRCEQARTVVKPFIAKYKSDNDGQLPTVERICREDYKLTIQNHVHNLGIMLLKALEVESSQSALRTPAVAPTTQVASVAAAIATADDAKIDEIIGGRKQKGKWPVPYDRVNKFTKCNELKRICFYKSVKHCHGIESIPKTDNNKEGRLLYALYATDKTHCLTTKRCSTCLIP